MNLFEKYNFIEGYLNRIFQDSREILRKEVYQMFTYKVWLMDGENCVLRTYVDAENMKTVVQVIFEMMENNDYIRGDLVTLEINREKR